MPSTIGWLDQSEEQQRRMREVIALFAESGTVDDIGIGVVRDAFSDLLFPGLSTVQTRLRYFLIVPWVYSRLEAERVSSDRAEERARRWELDLVRSLMSSGETEGVIGSTAGDTLKQLPSFIYWNGLRFAGIRQFGGTRADYHRALNRINQSTRRSVRGEGDETVGREPPRWHHHLPSCPDDLWESFPYASRCLGKTSRRGPSSAGVKYEVIGSPSPMSNQISRNVPSYSSSGDDVSFPYGVSAITSSSSARRGAS